MSSVPPITTFTVSLAGDIQNDASPNCKLRKNPKAEPSAAAIRTYLFDGRLKSKTTEPISNMAVVSSPQRVNSPNTVTFGMVTASKKVLYQGKGFLEANLVSVGASVVINMLLANFPKADLSQTNPRSN